MANLAKYVARLTLLRSFPSCRWISTAVKVVPAASNQRKRRGDPRFHELRRMEVSALSDTIDKWVQKGATLNRKDVANWVSQLRKSQKHEHALQVSEWMEKSMVEMNNSDQAIRIDLLYMNKGLAEAEKYFSGLPASALTIKTFGALFNCYSRENMTEKAVELFEQMRELGIALDTSDMNQLMHLYLKGGKPEKVHLVTQEMEDSGVALDKYSYNHSMHSYAALKDYDGVEKVLEKMALNNIKPGWFEYTTLARIYINAGFLDKANNALGKVEEEKSHDPEVYHTLISLYARTDNLSGVSRAWEFLKSIQKCSGYNNYLRMLTSLSKIQDVDMFEKYFKEWESSFPEPCVRGYNILLESYLNRGMLAEAESLSETLVSKKVKPNFQTLTLNMELQLKKGRADMALQFLEQGAKEVKEKKYNVKFPGDKIVSSFLKSLAEKKDAVSAHKFYEIMKSLNRLNSKISDSLCLLGVTEESETESD